MPFRFSHFRYGGSTPQNGELPDTVAFLMSSAALATLAATEAGDVPSMTAALRSTMQLVATEGPDVASMLVSQSGVAGANLATTEAGDSVVMTAILASGVALAASEAGDSVAMTAAVRTLVTIATTEAGDSVAASIAARTLMTLGTAEAADVVSMAASLSSPAWSATEKGADITLSNGQRTATKGASTPSAVKGITYRNSGTFGFSLTVDNNGGQPQNYALGVGIASATTSVQPGRSTGSYGWYGNGTIQVDDGTQIDTTAAYTAGDTIAIGLNLGTGQMQFSKNGTVLKTIGINAGQGAYVPMWGAFASGTAATLLTTPPAGYSLWD